MEFALDAEDLLKQDDQGVSFYEFVRLVLSSSQTENLEKTIAEVRRIPELMQQQEGLETVRGMVTLLQNEEFRDWSLPSARLLQGVVESTDGRT